MPEVPTATSPTLTPLPEMNPRIAGEPGRAMANAAEQMGSVADYGLQVAKKLEEAQDQVNIKQGEIAIDQIEAQAHKSVGKSTTPEQMQDIQRGFEEQSQEAANQYKNPKVSRELQFYSAHKSIGIQDLITVQQAKVTRENDLAANDMLGEKYKGNYTLAAASGGDTSFSERDEQILLANSVKNGTFTQEVADAQYDKWLRSAKMGTIEALSNSPKPEDRQRVIKILRGSGDESKNFTQGNESLNPVLQQVLKEYPGLAKNFNSKNTSLVFASGERQQRGSKERGGLEFWPPEGEPVATGGDATYPTPELGKNVLEVYSDDLKNNPEELKTAIQGDLLHGMTKDPYWKNLRDQFMKNFTPEEKERQNDAETWWDDVNGDRHAEQKGEIGHFRGNGTYDAYIRGWIFNEGGGRQGQVEQGNTMYSPKQIEILQEMDNYLKTGKSIEESTHSMSDHPLVDGMDLAQRNLALTAAENKDRELTNLAESHDLNGAANSVTKAYKESPTIYGTVDQKESALDSGNFLIQNEIYTVDEKTGEKIPDLVKAEKVRELLKPQFADELMKNKKEVNKIGDSVVDMVNGSDRDRFQKATEYLRSNQQMFEDTGNTDSYRSWMDYVGKTRREVVSEARAGVGLELSRISLERQLQNEKDTSALQDFNMSLPTHGYTNDEIISWGSQRKLSASAISKAITLNSSAQKSQEYQAGLQNAYSAVWRPTKPSGKSASDTTEVWSKYQQQTEWAKQWAWRTHELYDGFVNQGMGFPLAAENAKKQVVREQTAGKIDQMLGRSQGSIQSQLAVGTVRSGDGGMYRFKGGDQYDQKNWERVVK